MQCMNINPCRYAYALTRFGYCFLFKKPILLQGLELLPCQEQNMAYLHSLLVAVQIFTLAKILRWFHANNTRVFFSCKAPWQTHQAQQIALSTQPLHRHPCGSCWLGKQCSAGRIEPPVIIDPNDDTVSKYFFSHSDRKECKVQQQKVQASVFPIKMHTELSRSDPSSTLILLLVAW